MKLIGFRLTKIHAEKISNSTKELNLSTNIDISNIKKLTLPNFNKDDFFLEISFIYVLNYNPKIASIQLKGSLIVELNPDQAEEILTLWEKREIPKKIRFLLFNFILRKTFTKLLSLEEELGLPSHTPFPSIKEESQTAK